MSPEGVKALARVAELGSESERVSTRRARLFRAAILMGILVVGMAVVWFGFRAVLGTSTPFFVVSSGSMVPALNVGDVIVVKDSDTFQTLMKGDVIVFQRPVLKDRVIVHRVYAIIYDDLNMGVITKGDYNPAPDGWIVRENDYVGKVVLSVPQVGILAGWLAPPYNYLLIAVILVLIFLTEFRRRPKKEIDGFTSDS